MLPPPLFEAPPLGSGLPTLGNIFINNGAPAPSFIAQVFASADAGLGGGSARGFLGFGGGDANVFGSSTLAGLFGRHSATESEDNRIDWRARGDTGLDDTGVTGAPPLSQQLQELREGEQRQLRELALALGQIAPQAPHA